MIPNAEVTVLRRSAGQALPSGIIEVNTVEAEVIEPVVPCWIAEHFVQDNPESSIGVVSLTKKVSALIWPYGVWNPRERDVLYDRNTYQAYEIRELVHTRTPGVVLPQYAMLTTTVVNHEEVRVLERVWGPVFGTNFGAITEIIIEPIIEI